MSDKARIWVARIAFGIVFAWNVLCAIQFALWPQLYTSAYQLDGPGAQAAMQGIGVAFLMWNATYPAFIASPQRFRVLGPIIMAQQAIGLVGELCIAASLGPGQELLTQSIARFVGFDALGFVLMGGALALLFPKAALKGRRSSGPAS